MCECSIRPLPVTRLTIDKSYMTYLMNFGQKITCGTYIWHIEGPEENIIVDAGCPAELQTRGGFPAGQIASSEEALKKVGLKPADIDIVILTHLHTDHCADAYKYTNAKFIIQKEELESALNPHPAIAYMFNKKYFKKLNFETISGEEKITEGIRVFPTPGHSPCGQSVEVDTTLGKAIITGFCCIRENFKPPEIMKRTFRFIPPGIHINMMQLYESMVKVEERADIIVPLHDQEYLEKKSIP